MLATTVYGLVVADEEVNQWGVVCVKRFSLTYVPHQQWTANRNEKAIRLNNAVKGSLTKELGMLVFQPNHRHSQGKVWYCSRDGCHPVSTIVLSDDPTVKRGKQHKHNTP